MLPPIFERGGADYFQRFRAAMIGHVKEEKIERYFMAQSLWDDTMAWRVGQAHPEDSDQIFVVIVGEFHVEHGLGLPARLARHGRKNVTTLVQTKIRDWSSKNLETRGCASPSVRATRRLHLGLSGQLEQNAAQHQSRHRKIDHQPRDIHKGCDERAEAVAGSSPSLRSAKWQHSPRKRPPHTPRQSTTWPPLRRATCVIGESILHLSAYHHAQKSKHAKHNPRTSPEAIHET